MRRMVPTGSYTATAIGKSSRLLTSIWALTVPAWYLLTTRLMTDRYSTMFFRAPTNVATRSSAPSTTLSTCTLTSMSTITPSYTRIASLLRSLTWTFHIGTTPPTTTTTITSSARVIHSGLFSAPTVATPRRWPKSLRKEREISRLHHLFSLLFSYSLWFCR